MQVNALDHVNIVTADLDGTARFYAELFGLERRNGPPPLPPERVQWMYDAGGHPILHLSRTDSTVAPGPTGSIHHVALSCSGFDEMIARLGARSIEYKVNSIESIALRQVFARDPNGVLLELNFLGE